MKLIPLTNSHLMVKVDDDKYGLLLAAVKKGWCLKVSPDGKKYAYGRVGGRRVYMHRHLKSEPGMITDHEDGDGLNNQDYNLRICTRSQNMANISGHKDRAGKYKGVTQDPKSGKYKAVICLNGRNKRLGNFDRAIDAARAYDQAALKQWGEFSKTNGVWKPEVELANLID
jgi:hypothetical protein